MIANQSLGSLWGSSFGVPGTTLNAAQQCWAHDQDQDQSVAIVLLASSPVATTVSRKRMASAGSVWMATTMEDTVTTERIHAIIGRNVLPACGFSVV